MVSLSFSHITVEDIEYQLAHFDDNNGYVVTIVTSIFFVLSLALVVLRFVVRKWKHIRYRLEDYCIIVALVLATGLWIEALLSVKFGAGQHSLKVAQMHGIGYIVKSLQILLAVEMTYNLAHLAMKVSLLLLYRSIFTFVLVPFKRAWSVIFCYVILNAITSIFLLCFQCRPLKYSWEEPIGTKGKCVNLSAVEISNGVMIAFADLAILALPMPVLWSLHIPTKKKILLCGLFALGCLALIASITRVIYLGRVVSAVDFTFVGVNPLVWSIVEVNLGIICACIPTLKPLFSSRPKQATFGSSSNPLDKPSGRRYLTGALSLTTKITGSLDEFPLTDNSYTGAGIHESAPSSEAELQFITAKTM
ncbi:hypothetical protein BDV96DRAFT_655617 [Lophiotrema nucula]|uniref:Rhodopsin domain-containing protein n=1 Tax=Lophiotrema nucula TaxID=690887 RepID=A0A6A5YGY3_9PLEO|nr:hypothetical protein BDV96DRAFT_655617 [Lophiotrema nucula]